VNKKFRIVVAFLGILVFLAFYFSPAKLQFQKLNTNSNKYKVLIADFNNKQWAKYDNELQKVENASAPIIKCRNRLDAVKDSLLGDYKLALTKELTGDNELTKEEEYKSNLYVSIKQLSGSMYGLTYWYDVQASGKRNFDWGIFIVDAPSNYNESRYLKELHDAEENYAIKIRSIHDDFDKIEKVYCPQIDLPVKFPLFVKTCVELAKANHSFRKEPLRTSYDLEEEFLLDLSEYNKELDRDLERCNNQNF